MVKLKLRIIFARDKEISLVFYVEWSDEVLKLEVDGEILALELNNLEKVRLGSKIINN